MGDDRQPAPREPSPTGFLLVEKPPGVTSHDVVVIVRRTLGVRRVGHTGTLDPMAQGLLILLIGTATKQQQAWQGHEKIYEATLQLGVQTDTGDATGQPVRTMSVPMLDNARVEAVLASFCGPLVHTPPAYSAVKIQGRPAYWWARRQQPQVLAPRTITIMALTLLDLTSTTITFRVHCSAGTYVRTLGELIAERVGTVGHLMKLVRVRIGSWDLTQAIPLAELQRATSSALLQKLRPVPP